MRRPLVTSLVGILVIAVLSVVYTQVVGNKPLLGLDLQGGVSVVLKPVKKVDSGVLNQSISIIRSRVDALGVAEPDISRQGDAIVVQLPGVKDPERALRIVGTTAELRFRPVLNVLPASDNPATTTTAAPTTTTTAPSTTTTTSKVPTPVPTTTTTTTAPPGGTATTPREQDQPEKTVILPETKAGNVVRRYQLGPAELTGRVLKTARAQFDANNGAWAVNFELNGEGAKKFDELAAKYVGRQVAIVLDSEVKSAPTINTANFQGSGQITGDFTEKEAKELALVLRFGALPVQLQAENSEQVSASLGSDSLRAGLGAGLVGLALVVLYMILYYRALGLVVLLGLALSGALMWSIVSFLSANNGLALSLAGATGIIVSVGVTVDSYVVYFERLKDEIRAGKTIRSSVDRGFARAYRTILAADAASFIGAALLYLLTVGAVRGFAFFLGLSTVLDVVVAYFFTRPMVVLLGRNRAFTEAKWLGVARGLAATSEGGRA
ncbi:MAG TPA: protein translocase subunit SecD [Acidimicrobiales bacterium]|nr:protein translocase subunit SecD [Acidimicrobiales bacterium]